MKGCVDFKPNLVHIVSQIAKNQNSAPVHPGGQNG